MKDNRCAYMRQLDYKPCNHPAVARQVGSGIPLCQNHAMDLHERGAPVAEIQQGRIFYPNGKPMFRSNGMMLDINGKRSIFDDVDQ